ncbi:hypothetical protein JCGZ_18000 [Jatropha curcas]|uniref:DUF4408 domain-containing protein n=1 Tax=Jatropha curcas TaxID=180498 RepID=A0A067JSI5_JATCU|nr:hypothetical protein JCGZ_18000 [Jatropha curcas]
MDTLSNTKKLQAMNNYYKITQFLQNIIVDLFLIAFTCSLLFSCSYWFSFFKKLVFDTNYYSSIFSPKCLFIVVNVIVLFLVGESKLTGDSNSSAIYDDYVERSRSLRALSNFQEKIENSKLELISLSEEKKIINNIVQDGKVMEEVTETIEEEEEEYEEVEEEILQEAQEVEEECQEEEEEEKDIRDEEEEIGLLPTEELNKRVEEFIARVNKQRWLEEARLLVCCAA